MGLIKNIQAILLKRDIEKGLGYRYLADKYPMSLLIEHKVFERFNNTELYKPQNGNELFSIKGDCLGAITPFTYKTLEESKYIVVVNENGVYENSIESQTYAVYDKSGRCVVPHSCYSLGYEAQDYMVLTMPMECQYGEYGREYRIVRSTDEETVFESTGKSLKETLGGSFNMPRALIIARDRIITTQYLSVEPVDVQEYVEPYDNNIIWIAQKDNNESVTFKFDKRLFITETYRLPYFASSELVFYMDGKTNAVYFIDGEKKVRINLRTGEQVSLLNLKRTKLSKQERFAVTEEAKAEVDVTETAETDELVETTDSFVDAEETTEVTTTETD